MRSCKKHGELNLEDTYQEKNKSCISGFTTRCKSCKKERTKIDYDRHAKERIEKAQAWKVKNRDRINSQVRLDRANNPEKHKEWSRRGRERAGPIRSLKEVTRIRGITLEYYYSLIGQQNNLCAICNMSETRKNIRGEISRLCIDHNHSTGFVRALLCHGCNQTIGHAKESIEILQKAIEYLKKHSTKDGITLERKND